MKNIYKILHGVVLTFATTISFAQSTRQNLWVDASENTFSSQGTRVIVPQHYRSIHINVDEARGYLANAQGQSAMRVSQSPIIVSLPMPDGGSRQFRIVEAPVMHSLLAAKYPMIKTYSGQGIDDATAVVRIDITQFGFHAMILSPNGDVFIDPYRHSLQTATDYISYYRKDYSNSSKQFACGVTDEMTEDFAGRSSFPSVNRTIGDELRDYRLALACTGEYAAYYGGTTAGALAGMVTSVNRVTGVYELEVDIRLTLVPNTDTLIFLNASTDPYDNNNGGTMLGQNQTTCNQRIGANNYDIGHVFSTGGGGIAQLGCVCGSSKAQGVTGSPAPVGDAFDIDYVAHEMGHQFGGNHTFNSVTSSCNGNRAASAAYEPGSGITIMAYAGICGGDNLAQHSIANFHTKSFDEIVNYSTINNGNSCPVVTLTGNNPPVINPLVHSWNIPYLTPFFLTGSATDLDVADTLTYSWEEFDLGPAGTWNAPSGNAPIFKSYSPSTSALRLFPKLNNILNNIPNSNVNAKGELKPSYARVLHFRLTARDNKLNGGGVTYDDTLVAINVVNTVDTFQITYPNVTGISWAAGSTQSITWNVANTTNAPITTPNVNIYLSTDGGQTFPVTLATNVPNSGSYTLASVPNNQTTTARVWVEGAGSIFFDINDKNFAITAPVGIDEITANDLLNVYPNPGNGNFEVAYASKTNGGVEFHVTNALGERIKTTKAEKTSEFFHYNLDLRNLANGIYFLEFILPEGKAVKRITKM